jgi:hypothetical protein
MIKLHRRRRRCFRRLSGGAPLFYIDEVDLWRLLFREIDVRDWLRARWRRVLWKALA